MGAFRQKLPAGIAEIAEAIGEHAALEFVLMRWVRSAERARAKGKPPPRSVCLHIPKRMPADHLFAQGLGAERAAALSAALGGEKITAQVPTWLVDHDIIECGFRYIAEGTPPTKVGRLLGKHPSTWSRLANESPRHNPLAGINENIAIECMHLIRERRRKSRERTRS